MAVLFVLLFKPAFALNYQFFTFDLCPILAATQSAIGMSVAAESP
jgi:hypothetical protein